MVTIEQWKMACENTNTADCQGCSVYLMRDVGFGPPKVKHVRHGMPPIGNPATVLAMLKFLICARYRYLAVINGEKDLDVAIVMACAALPHAE